MVSILRMFGRKSDHAEIREGASDYIDGDLDPEAAAAIKSHLDMCPPCRTFFETLRATIGLLGSSKREEPRASFRKRLKDRLHAERGR